MPAAHALLQVRQDIPTLLDGLTVEQIWHTPGRSASIGFHALHIAGATERLFTYARGESLTAEQLDAARDERGATGLDARELVRRVERSIDAAMDEIRQTAGERVAEARPVGRQRLPSTVLGLIFHAAEHAARHAGQIATLRKIVNP